MRIISSDIITCFDDAPIGTKVLLGPSFLLELARTIQDHDFERERVPGQAFINVPSLIPYVSGGVGLKRPNPDDYILKSHRGVVSAYLKREFASKVTGLAVVVYTIKAYLNDPDVTEEEAERVKREAERDGATHVLVAVLASSGEEGPRLSPHRFTANLAGGNHEAQLWSADEIRQKAKDIMGYENMWSVVAG